MHNTIKHKESAKLNRLVDEWVKKGNEIKQVVNEVKPIEKQKPRGIIKMQAVK